MIIHWITIPVLAVTVAFNCLIDLACKKRTAQTPPSTTQTTTSDSLLPTEKLSIGTEEFTVELAFQRHSRKQGLMYRKHLAKNAGMIFIFKQSRQQSFYMKNCLIDLDIIFIKQDGSIDSVATMKAPIDNKPLKYYNSLSPVKYVLELPAGSAKRLKLKQNQKIKIPKKIKNIIPDK